MYASNPDEWNPSDFDDSDEALLIIAAEPVEAREDNTSICLSRPGSHTPNTPHSHDYEPCNGGGVYGQGAPVYSCRCYIRTKVDPGLALADLDVSEQYHEPERLEQDIDSWNTQVGGHSGGIRPLKRKRSESKSALDLDSIGDITTPRRFGQNLTNVKHAKSVPALEMPKRRKLRKAFEFDGSPTRAHETLVFDVVKHLEAAIDRQTCQANLLIMTPSVVNLFYEYSRALFDTRSCTMCDVHRNIDRNPADNSARYHFHDRRNIRNLYNFSHNLTLFKFMSLWPWCQYTQNYSSAGLACHTRLCLFELHEVTGAPQYNYSHVNQWVWHLSGAKCLSSVRWAIFALCDAKSSPWRTIYNTARAIFCNAHLVWFLRYYSCHLEWSPFYLTLTELLIPSSREARWRRHHCEVRRK
ncbi:uncharacterized protein HD556DRAFT_1309351 [Suillus plorans]|uniref:Uncharacterized protein n=1 Tax=Suillus plorans TaxID=116603 RepID=A0A9P7AM86_9AGAM|nr:uncharacterized protein HD556DRAFT_1309351 [Suillus plorans]KAG1792274.1 hypothetical protein HD556DRAFT_1309351 [Suillus plorans]